MSNLTGLDGAPHRQPPGLCVPLPQFSVTPSLVLLVERLNGQAYTHCISFNIYKNPVKENQYPNFIDKNT